MSVKFVTSTVLKAVNQASAPMRKMALDAQKLKRQFRGAQKAADGLGKAGKKLTTNFTAPVALGLAGVIAQSSSFEDAMTGVAKQLPDEAGANGLKNIQKQILAIASVSNQAPQQIAAIAEEAGKAAIPFKDWAKFIDLTTKSATALDIEGGEAAETLLAIGAGLGIRGDLGALAQFAADANLVADSVKATAPELLDFTKRVAGVARIAGASSDAILAIGGAFIDTGTESETAARATAKLFTVLGTNVGVTKKARQAFEQLKLPKDFVTQFRKDAPAALKILSENLLKLDKNSQLGVLKKAFGEDQAKNIAKLLVNTEKLGILVQKVGDKGKSSLKFNEEYSRQLATFNSQWQMMKNSVFKFSVELGTTLLPMLKELFNEIKPVISSMVDWMKNNKKATATLLTLTIAAAALGPVFIAIAGAASGILFMTQTIILLGSTFKVAAGAAWLFSTASKAVSSAMAILNVVMSANPIGLIIIGIAALAAGFAYLVHKTGGVTDAFIAIGGFLLNFTPFGILAKSIYENWGGISSFFENIFANVKSIFSKGVLIILNHIKSVTSALSFVVPDSVLNDLDQKIAKFEGLSNGGFASQSIRDDFNKSQPLELVGGGSNDKIDTHITVQVEGAQVKKTSSTTNARGGRGSRVGNIGVSMLPQ